MQPLELADLKDLRLAVEGLGLRPHVIAETGSKAWGTDVDTSDHDLTVIADDIVYDIYAWPRTAFTQKIQFNGEEIDCRVFSPERFLRKIVKSNLSAYEVIHTHWHFGDNYLRSLLTESLDRFYDPREMFRSSRGNISEIRSKGVKGKRQMFRYSFICIQLIESLQNGRKPMMNVHEYLNSPDTALFSQLLVSNMLKWAHTEESVASLDHEMEVTLARIRDFDFPAVVNFKQGEEREFMNVQFAKYKEWVAK
jgi:hypothetical protein